MSDIIKLRNASFFLNGIGHEQVVDEVTLPAIEAITKEHHPSAMRAPLELTSGHKVTPLVVKGDFHPAVIAAAADIYHTQLVQVRSNAETLDATGRTMEQSVVAHLVVLSKGFKSDAIKGTEEGKFEITLSPWIYKLEVDGVPIYNIDIKANKYEVLAKNLLATTNDNLGL